MTRTRETSQPRPPDEPPASRRSLGCQLLLWTAGLAAALIGAYLAFVLWWALVVSGCVVEGTRVETPEGPRPVESLRIGDGVLTRGASGVEVGTVVGITRSRTLSHLELNFSGGRLLRVTGSHPVAAAAGWRPAGELAPDASVELRHGSETLRSVERAFGLAVVYDITVAPNSTFFAEGVLVHNKGARSGAATLGDVRTVISAQAAYQSANQGYYEGRLECLATPWKCIPGYPEDGPRFLDEVRASLGTQHGYTREFLPGQPVEHPSKGSSPSSVEGYSYVALPLVDGGDTDRAFCGDSSGILCFTPNGERPLVEDGHCVVEGIHVPEVPEPWFFERWFSTPPSSRPCKVLQ